MPAGFQKEQGAKKKSKAEKMERGKKAEEDIRCAQFNILCE